MMVLTTDDKRVRPCLATVAKDGKQMIPTMDQAENWRREKFQYVDYKNE